MARTVFPYWILPLISAGTWIGMLIAMLVVYIKEGSPYYPSFNPGQRIPYISDIGAEGLKPLFIAGSCVTTVFLDPSFAAERYLRHTGALTRNTTRVEKILSVFAILFAVVGTAGLILLSIFDTLRHPRLHDIFLLLFVAGYVISAIFICAEYQRLGAHFRQQRVLRISFWIKLMFIILEVILAVTFGALDFKGPTNVAAVFEWVVALIFTFWVLSFFIDLLPAVQLHRHGARQSAKSTSSHGRMEMGEAGPAALAGTTSGPGYVNDESATRYGRTNGNINGSSQGHGLYNHNNDNDIRAPSRGTNDTSTTVGGGYPPTHTNGTGNGNGYNINGTIVPADFFAAKKEGHSGASNGTFLTACLIRKHPTNIENLSMGNTKERKKHGLSCPILSYPTKLKAFHRY